MSQFQFVALTSSQVNVWRVKWLTLGWSHLNVKPRRGLFFVSGFGADRDHFNAESHLRPVSPGEFVSNATWQRWLDWSSHNIARSHGSVINWPNWTKTIGSVRKRISDSRIRCLLLTSSHNWIKILGRHVLLGVFGPPAACHSLQSLSNSGVRRWPETSGEIWYFDVFCGRSCCGFRIVLELLGH